MSHILKFCFVAFVMLFTTTAVHAQYPSSDCVVITVEKEGKLESLIKKAGAQKATKLIIKEASADYHEKQRLNEKDLACLAKMPQLEELHLDIDIRCYLSESEVTNATLPNLKVLGLYKRQSYDFLKLNIEDFVVNKEINYAPSDIEFNNLYILSAQEEQSNYSYKGFVQGNNNEWIDLTSYGDKFSNGERIATPALIKQIRQNNGKIHQVNSIHVYDRKSLISRVIEGVYTAMIYIHSGDKTEKYLVNYSLLSNDADKDLTLYDELLSGSLYDATFDVIKLPKGMKRVAPLLFLGVEANNIDLSDVELLDENAFYGINVKNIHIPASVQTINEAAFNGSEIENVVFENEYPPVITESYVQEKHGWYKIKFTVPKGSRNNYFIGAWKKLKINEVGAKTDYDISVPTPGGLKDLLTDDIMLSVTKLKLSGILYSDDIMLLEDCPNLITLDLREAFIIQSPKELKAKQDEQDFLLGMFMGMGAISQAEYEMGRISTTDNLQVQLLARLAEMSKSEKIKSDPNCQMPNLNKTTVENLILPSMLQYIRYGLPDNLKTLVLPPDVNKIDIYIPKHLESLIIPSSVKELSLNTSSQYSYDIRCLDLSQLEDATISLDIRVHRLETFKCPKSFKVKKRASVTTFAQKITAYFTQREPPEGLYLHVGKELELHIPRGARAGYSDLINSNYTDVTVVEE